MATPTPTAKKVDQPIAPKPIRRDDHTHLERLDHLGLVRDESDEKGPVEALFTHRNDSACAHKPLI